MSNGVSRETFLMLNKNKTALEHVAALYNLSTQQVEQFGLYVELLESWSLRTNLISKNDRAKIVSRHIVESLEITQHDLVKDFSSVIDLGTGSGLPGIPLAIYYPNSHFTLLDSKRMKILFLQEVIDRLKLKNVIAVCSRAEDFSPEHPCDILTARAVASLKDLWSFGWSFLKENGMLVALKGGDIEYEVQEVEHGYAVRTRILPFSGSSYPFSVDKKIVLVSKK